MNKSNIEKQADVLDSARDLYRSAPLFPRLLQSYRPYICPFEELVRRVPVGSRVLDIGCGAGLLLGLLGRAGRITQGTGFDTSVSAIEIAVDMARRNFPDGRISFSTYTVGDPWPDGPFDVVCMIDVLHHIPPEAQKDAVLEGLAHVRSGGLFLYKDMVQRPWWQAAWNRLHDLVLARQWINYRPIAEVRAWLLAEGWKIADEALFNNMVYGHELILARRP